MRWALIALIIGLAGLRAHADPTFDHAKTRFPLVGRHTTVACESCHPPSATGSSGRQWTGIPLDCHGCHGDRKNHKGELGVACATCHDTSGWKSISHPASKHRFPLVGTHQLGCVSCHAGGKHLTDAVAVCADCHVQPHPGTTAACTTCHALTRWTPVSFKHAVDPKVLGGKHVAATCLGCHPGFKFVGSSLACDSCHRKDLPHEVIASCDGCHVATAGWANIRLRHDPAAPPPGPFAVTAAFDHVAHARKATALGMKATCAPCHTAFENLRPRARPTMPSCEGCHNGKRAFAALGTQCGRCHRAAAGTVLAVLPATQTPFLHEQHAKLGVNTADCKSCHATSTVAIQTRAGAAQHQPCVQCHAAEFRIMGSKMCLGCHERNDPFAPNPLRASIAITTEWRAGELPHAAHVAATLECKVCHASQAGTAGAAPAPSHALCGTCHVVGGSASTDLGNCSACHVLASTPRTHTVRPWSTRALFQHDANHLASPCEACHRIDAATAAPAPPTMTSCASCHDGQRAFKTTGFECSRCHRAQRPGGTSSAGASPT